MKTEVNEYELRLIILGLEKLAEGNKYPEEVIRDIWNIRNRLAKREMEITYNASK